MTTFESILCENKNLRDEVFELRERNEGYQKYIDNVEYIVEPSDISI